MTMMDTWTSDDDFRTDDEVWVDTDGDGLADYIDPNSTVVLLYRDPLYKWVDNTHHSRRIIVPSLYQRARHLISR